MVSESLFYPHLYNLVDFLAIFVCNFVFFRCKVPGGHATILSVRPAGVFMVFFFQ